MTDTHQSPQFSNFGIYNRRVIEVITQWQGELKYFPAIVSWIGFSQSILTVEQDALLPGHSSHTFAKLVGTWPERYCGFSDKPLQVGDGHRIRDGLLSFGMAFFVLVSHLTGTLTVQGWASIALSLWFVAGCLMLRVGLTGLYVGRILVEVKGRPSFIVDQVVSQAATISHSDDSHLLDLLRGETRNDVAVRTTSWYAPRVKGCIVRGGDCGEGN